MKITSLLCSTLIIGLSLVLTASYADSPGCISTCKAFTNSNTNTDFHCLHTDAKTKVTKPFDIKLSLDQQKVLEKGNSFKLHDNTPHQVEKIQKTEDGTIKEATFVKK